MYVDLISYNPFKFVRKEEENNRVNRPIPRTIIIMLLSSANNSFAHFKIIIYIYIYIREVGKTRRDHLIERRVVVVEFINNLILFTNYVYIHTYIHT